MPAHLKEVRGVKTKKDTGKWHFKLRRGVGVDVLQFSPTPQTGSLVDGYELTIQDSEHVALRTFAAGSVKSTRIISVRPAADGSFNIVL